MFNRKGFTLTEAILLFFVILAGIASIIMFISIIHYLWS